MSDYAVPLLASSVSVYLLLKLLYMQLYTESRVRELIYDNASNEQTIECLRQDVVQLKSDIQGHERTITRLRNRRHYRR
jgi:uncharacterized coiled-coil protein SlyX